MRKSSPRLLAVSLLVLPLCLSACAPDLKPVNGGSYRDPQVGFELTLPQEDGWQLLSWEDVDFVLWEPKTGATIVVDVNPLKEDLEPAVLTNQLLIAFERKQIISQDTVMVNGREAMKTILEGWVERTEITAEVYVMRGGGSFYDVMFWAPHDAFPRKVEQFHLFLLGINFLQPKGPQ
jgi:hypothetical protein